MNGTTNYMLSKMANEHLDYDEVLKEAQAKGYAESDPTADVGGLDAARKIVILASIASIPASIWTMCRLKALKASKPAISNMQLTSVTQLSFWQSQERSGKRCQPAC